TAETRAGEVQHLVQHVEHHHAFGHVERIMPATVDRQRELASRQAHPTTFRIWSAVTGSVRKRWPIAWAMPFTMAAMIGIATTSAMPLGGSSSDRGGRMSAVCVHTATSLPRGRR